MLDSLWFAALLCLFAFLSGSVPYSLIIATRKGIDLRQVGSGNIGATNVARVLGLRFGVLALVLDMFKGLVPSLVARWVYGDLAAYGRFIGAVMISAVLGHMFTVFLRFRGGKGVATALGTFLAVCPAAGALGALLYVGLYAKFRISSLGSMAMIVAVPIAMTLLHMPTSILVATCVIALLIVIKHVPNLRRLLRGEESKV